MTRRGTLFVRIRVVGRRAVVICMVICVMIRMVVIVMMMVIHMMMRMRRTAMMAITIVPVRPMAVVVAAYNVILHAAHIFHGGARRNGGHEFFVLIRTVVLIRGVAAAGDGVTTNACRDDAGGESDQWGEEKSYDCCFGKMLDHRCLRNNAVGPETRRLANLFKTFAKNVCEGRSEAAGRRFFRVRGNIIPLVGLAAPCFNGANETHLGPGLWCEYARPGGRPGGVVLRGL